MSKRKKNKKPKKGLHIKCPWCSKQVLVTDKELLQQHFYNRKQKHCVGSGQPWHSVKLLVDRKEKFKKSKEEG